MNNFPIDRLRLLFQRTLRNEHGSIAASVTFVAATAVLAAGLLTMTLSSTLAGASTTAHRGVVNSVAQTAEIYRGTASEPSTPAAPCTGTLCSTVTDINDADGLRQVTIRGAGPSSSVTLEQSLRPVEGTHIAGFDAAGNPVWTTTGPGAKFHGYVNGGTK